MPAFIEHSLCPSVRDLHSMHTTSKRCSGMLACMLHASRHTWTLRPAAAQGVPPCSLVVSDAGGGGFVVVDSTGRALFSTLRVLALPSQTAYVYNAVSGSWAAAGSLPASEPNYEFAQTRLHSGSVLLAGGLGAPSAHAYLFSPASLAFSPTGSMAVPRASHQLVTSFGGSALAVGGTTGPSPTSAPGGQLTGSIEAFSPSSGTWRQAGALVLPRAGHASVVLPNGQVLTTGGFADDGPRRATKRAELFDPVLGTSRETGSMGSPRAGHSMLLLADGTALACGGINTMPVLDDGGQFSGTEYLISCDLYTPSKGSWEQTGNMTKRLLEAAGQPFVPWVGFTLSLLPNGQVLASGPPLDFNASLCVQQFNLFDAHARTWSEPAPPVPSFFGPQNLLPTGELLLANAFSSVSECQNSFRLPPSTTLYNPITGNLQVTGSLPVFRTQPYLLSTAVLF